MKRLLFGTDPGSLFARESGTSTWGHFGMCPMLRNLRLLRPDIAQQYDVTTEAGLADAIAWMFSRAVPEYRLAYLIDPITLQALNTPVSYYPEDAMACPAGAHTSIQVPLTFLMGLTWRHRSDVQPVFDINTPLGRARFTLWFIDHGVSELKLQPLVSPAWRQWLLSPQTMGCCRLGLLAWLTRPDLRTAFDINTPAGLSNLHSWTLHSLETEPGWRWLIDTSDAPDPDLRWVSKPESAFGVNLIGFAKGELGIGEDMRMAVAACEAAGIPYSLINISTGTNTRQEDTALDKHVSVPSRAPYPVNIFCLTGFETFRVFFEQGPGLFANRHNIGWWPWELPVWPAEWSSAFNLVHEVWAATEFTRGMYSTASSIPITHMPMAVCIERRERIRRDQLGLPARKILFLYIFDFNSYLARKNPMAAVKAFRRAFPAGDKSVGLVLKTMNSNPQNRVWQRFLKECAEDERIIVLERTLNRGEVLGLIDACDVYVSLHRSEGFGRTLAEAMLFGKPVVGTDFSGNADFLKPEVGFPVKWKRRVVKSGEYPFVTESDGAWWAEPDIADAAQQMQRARLAAQDKQFAQRVKQFAQQQFSPERIGKLMKQRLQEIVKGYL